MISVATPKDLRKVKSKVVGNFTKRQIICFGLAALVGIPFYLATRKVVGTDIAAILMIGVAMPFFFLAMYERNGMPAEKYLALIIRHKTLPQIRPYEAENLFLQLEKRKKIEKEVLYLEDKARIGKGKHSAENGSSAGKTADDESKRISGSVLQKNNRT